MSTITGQETIAMSDAGAAAGVRRAEVGLAVLRIIIGAVFVAHGAQKLFMIGLPGLIEGFGAMGVPLAGIAAPAVALLEFVGGFALIAGLFVAPIALGLMVVMVGAAFIVHMPAGFFMPDGYEFVMTLAAAALAVALAGPGAWSLDGMRAARRAAE